MKAIPTAILAAALALGAGAARAQLSSDHATVNSYTAEDLRKAQAAASAAGFSQSIVASAQDRNLFLRATKEGKTYFLTVTPDGHVYASAAT